MLALFHAHQHLVAMEQWISKHHVYAVKAFHQNGSSYELVCHGFRNSFKIHRN